jgi:3'-phosphoadenosine 5'-phosphosulfate sulfotransferase (PAPS reductase)/FAD synthetase
MAACAVTAIAPPAPLEQLSLFPPAPRLDPYEVLDRAIAEHNPTHVFALFSGGHDSVCSTYLASQHPRFTGAVHVNTGIGVEETRQYVRELCRVRHWPLLEMHPPNKTYRDIVLDPRWGFPGPAAHPHIYVWLKERAIRKLVRDHKRKWKDRVLLVSGLRRQESAQRAKASELVHREGANVWVNVIHDWSALERLPFMEREGLPRNRVVDVLHFSGECLDGSKSSPGERQLLRDFFPAAEQQISDLEAEAREAGVPACRWGQRPPATSEQSRLRGPNLLDLLPMCAGCPVFQGEAS